MVFIGEPFFHKRPKLFWKGCVKIQNGPMEIILGDGPGPNRQVADPFQTYWGCTFANLLRLLAPNYPKWAILDI